MRFPRKIPETVVRPIPLNLGAVLQDTFFLCGIAPNHLRLTERDKRSEQQLDGSCT